MTGRSARQRDHWEDLSIVMRASAYSLYSRTRVYMVSDPEDFAQDVAMAVWKFAQKRAATKDIFVIDESFVIEMYAYGYRCLKHRFLLELRKVRNRERLFPLAHGDPVELERLHGIVEPALVTHEQRLICESLIAAMETRMRRKSARKIIDGLKRLDAIFDDDAGISMTVLGEEVGVSRATIGRFGEKLRRQGILDPRERRRMSRNPDRDAKRQCKDENDEIA